MPLCYSINAFSRLCLYLPTHCDYSTGAFVSLAQLVAECVASRIEAAARRKRFTQLGGLQLDKDIRAVMAMFVSRAGGSVRTPFARLQQVLCYCSPLLCVFLCEFAAVQL
jgi:hypothetical protein